MHWHGGGTISGTQVRIRTNVATHAHFKLATPTRLKVATQSHFKVATLRRAAVRREPDIDDARNPNASRRQYPQSRRCQHEAFLLALGVKHVGKRQLVRLWLFIEMRYCCYITILFAIGPHSGIVKSSLLRKLAWQADAKSLSIYDDFSCYVVRGGADRFTNL
jgi:hypothetical protein